MDAVPTRSGSSSRGEQHSSSSHGHGSLGRHDHGPSSSRTAAASSSHGHPSLEDEGVGDEDDGHEEINTSQIPDAPRPSQPTRSPFELRPGNRPRREAIFTPSLYEKRNPGGIGEGTEQEEQGSGTRKGTMLPRIRGGRRWRPREGKHRQDVGRVISEKDKFVMIFCVPYVNPYVLNFMCELLCREPLYRKTSCVNSDV